MKVSDIKTKPRTHSVRQKKPEKDADKLLKKEFFLVYNAYSAFANACEETWPKPTRAMFRKIISIGIEPRKIRVEKHLNRRIISAESWTERDKLYRSLASQCYETAQCLKRTGDLKQAAKWMNLVLRFLRLSLDPKAKQQMDDVLKELSELKTAMKEHESEKLEEEDVAENDSEGKERD